MQNFSSISPNLGMADLGYTFSKNQTCVLIPLTLALSCSYSCLLSYMEGFAWVTGFAYARFLEDGDGRLLAPQYGKLAPLCASAWNAAVSSVPSQGHESYTQTWIIGINCAIVHKSGQNAHSFYIGHSTLSCAHLPAPRLPVPQEQW